MIKRIGKHSVDVSSRACDESLECYQLGFDKGTYVQGRGYASYRKKPLPVCWTRYLRGCPEAGVCLDCRSIASPATMRLGKCGWCGGENLEPRELKQ